VWRQPNWPVKLTYAKGRRFALAFCSGSLPLTLAIIQNLTSVRY
jgi:hypothetical protein